MIHPQPQCKVYGDEVIFNVAATGAGTLVYQWMKDEKVVLGDKSHCYHGEDTPTLQITSFSPKHEGRYKCVIKNEHSDVLYSSPADLKGELKVLTLNYQMNILSKNKIISFLRINERQWIHFWS